METIYTAPGRIFSVLEDVRRDAQPGAHDTAALRQASEDLEGLIPLLTDTIAHVNDSIEDGDDGTDD
ncbi:hypothetical protein [Streptomyces sp. NPDC058297]|uniref:hypothetical protein n=1 Tax=Streptomyces sp. NPDC058297 TaxID=3346433 RepID=UPI0036F0F88A